MTLFSLEKRARTLSRACPNVKVPRAIVQPMIRTILSVFAVGTVVVACAGQKFIAVTAYDQQCNADAECQAIRVGSTCDCVPQWDAIHKNDSMKYDEDSRGMWSDNARAACTSCREPPNLVAKAICSGRKCTAVVTKAGAPQKDAPPPAPASDGVKE